MKEQLLELNQGSREDLIKAREKLVEKIEDLSLKSCKRIIRAYSFVDAIDNLDDYTKNLSEEEKLLFAQFAIYIENLMGFHQLGQELNKGEGNV